MTRSLHLRTGALTALAASLALAAPLTAPAAAAQNQGGGKTQVTCKGKGGGKPGEKVTETVYVTLRGKIIQSSKWTYICGEDGLWHTVLT